jgi:peptide/nickel transport system ATP-binding protein/oligopeptide transport system ATP-binding protein
MSAPPPLLSVQDLRIAIGGNILVDGVTFDVAAGEVLGLVGESGSGKSLSLRAILKLLPPHAAVTGRVFYQGRDLLPLAESAVRPLRGRQIAMVFQEPMTALDPVLPVGLQIVESLQEHLGVSRQQARVRAVELLDLVGIPDARRRLDNYPHEFSGGMRQRAMIAIALAPEPKLLLADEPTTALDVTIQDQILKLLLRLKRELGMSIVIVTHDLGVVAETCDRVAVMYAGKVMESGPVEAVFESASHAYTLGLMRSVPDGNHARQKLASIPGGPPEPGHLPPGCRFHPRCSFGTDACTVRPPSLVRLAPDHFSACLHTQRVQADALVQS